MVRLIFVAQVAATLFMVGVIWVMQIVHYPLFARVGAGEFPVYQLAHMRLISFVVIPPMLTELATAAAMLLYRPPGISRAAAIIGAALLAIIWLSTFILQGRQHGDLAAGFQADLHRNLVLTNWIRTVAWSARGGLMLWLTAKLLA